MAPKSAATAGRRVQPNWPFRCISLFFHEITAEPQSFFEEIRASLRKGLAVFRCFCPLFSRYCCDKSTKLFLKCDASTTAPEAYHFARVPFYGLIVNKLIIKSPITINNKIASCIISSAHGAEVSDGRG